MEAQANSLQFYEPTPVGVAEHFQNDVSTKANEKFDHVFVDNLADRSKKEIFHLSWNKGKTDWKSSTSLTIFVGGSVDIAFFRFIVEMK